MTSHSRSRRITTVTLALVASFVIAAEAEAQTPQPQMCGTGGTFTVALPAVSGDVSADSIQLPKGCSIYALFVTDYGRNQALDELTFYPLARYIAEHNGYVHWSWWNNLLKPYLEGPVHTVFDGRPHHPGPVPRLGLWRKALEGTYEGITGEDIIGVPHEPEIFFNSVHRSLSLPVLDAGLLLSLLATTSADVRAGQIYEPNDDQFRSDARQWLFRVHAENPDAKIIVVGHGFGAHAAAKVLKSASGTPIALAGLIDPVGNTTTPSGVRFLSRLFPGLSKWLDELFGPARYPHTEPDSRWRGTREFLGYRQNDCVRESADSLLCKDFDPRLLVVERRCLPNGLQADTPSGWLDTPPVIGSLRPLLCPGMVIHNPTALSIGANVGTLYHRWQIEIDPPSDSSKPYNFTRAGAPSIRLGDNNIQAVMTSVALGNNPNVNPPGTGPIVRGATCHSTIENCSSMDGHDEMVGFRGIPVTGLGADLLVERGRDGVKARQWALSTADRRAAFAQMGAGISAFLEFENAGPSYQPDLDPWPHSPMTFEDGWINASGNDCIVCSDLLYLAERVIGGDEGEPAVDTIAPSTEATTDTLPNENGWHRADVKVKLAATDQGGAGVKEIEHTPSGAHAGEPTVTPGAMAEQLIDTDGITAVAYQARDNATPTNEETVKTFVVMLDRTVPEVSAAVVPSANAHGWHNTNVTVTFTATDATSGVVQASPVDPVTVETEGAVQEIEGTAIDAAGNSGSHGVVLNIDKTSPELTGSADRVPDSNGWYNRALTITWSCVDVLSGVQSRSDATTYAGPDKDTMAISGSCVDRADNAATASIDVRFDATAPTTIGTPDQSPNGNGWLRAAVAVHLAATDLGSGVQEIESALSGAQSSGNSTAPGNSASRTIDTDGITTLTYRARDVAGNEENPRTFVARLDRVPPTVSAAVAPAANAFGWHSSDVTVTFSATDATSGVATMSPAAPVVVAAEGANQEIDGSAVDHAGNEATHSVVLNVDKAAPSVTPTPDRAADSNGWYNRTFSIGWPCTDALSGVQSASGASGYAGPDTATGALTGSCLDRASNSTTASVEFRYDATAPVVTITSPAATLYLLNASVPAAYNCADNLSGIASCVGSVPAGAVIDTSSVGGKMFAGSALDVAGNAAAASTTYSVRYAYQGPFSPVEAMPQVNVARAGRTIPLKYRLTDANGVTITDVSSFASLQSAPVACDSTAIENVIQEEAEMNAAGVRFDPASNQFIVNWQTSSGWSGCRLLQLRLSDGSEHTALFNFR